MKKIVLIGAMIALLSGCSGTMQKPEGSEKKPEGSDEIKLEDINVSTKIYDCQGQEIKIEYTYGGTSPATARIMGAGYADEPLVFDATNPEALPIGDAYQNSTMIMIEQRKVVVIRSKDDNASVSCTEKMTEEQLKNAVKDHNGNIVDPGCSQWFDGCNTCSFDGKRLSSCSMWHCTKDKIEKARCLNVGV